MRTLNTLRTHVESNVNRPLGTFMRVAEKRSPTLVHLRRGSANAETEHHDPNGHQCATKRIGSAQPIANQWDRHERPTKGDERDIMAELLKLDV